MEYQRDRRPRMAADRARMLERALLKGGYLMGGEPLKGETMKELLPHIIADCLHMLSASGGTATMTEVDELARQGWLYYDAELKFQVK